MRAAVGGIAGSHEPEDPACVGNRTDPVWCQSRVIARVGLGGVIDKALEDVYWWTTFFVLGLAVAAAGIRALFLIARYFRNVTR